MEIAQTARNGKRAYRQSSRAALTRATKALVATTFYDMLATHWIDEITLDEVAAAARTTRQTILRMFGSKEGLLATALETVELKAAPRFRPTEEDGLAAALGDLIDHYEEVGGMVFRLLAQEDRNAPLRPLLARGRQMHRDWVAERLNTAVNRVGPGDRHLTQLVAATDVYVWKLLRRDLGLPRDEVLAVIGGMVARLTGDRWS